MYKLTTSPISVVKDVNRKNKSIMYVWAIFLLIESILNIELKDTNQTSYFFEGIYVISTNSKTKQILKLN